MVQFEISGFKASFPKLRAFTGGAGNLAWRVLWRSARDPSLRLNCGYAQDDAVFVETAPLPRLSLKLAPVML